MRRVSLAAEFLNTDGLVLLDTNGLSEEKRKERAELIVRASYYQMAEHIALETERKIREQRK